MATSERAAPTAPRPPPALPVVEPLPLALLDDPLDYLIADHARQRAIGAVLGRFASMQQAGRREADMVVAYLRHDLVLHHADEDLDLFPALRRRAMSEDALGPVLEQLAEDHRWSEPMAERIAATLAATPGADRVRLDARARDLLATYAAAEHRHLALENGVVLGIARIRLHRSDLRMIARAMKARRGVGG